MLQMHVPRNTTGAIGVLLLTLWQENKALLTKSHQPHQAAPADIMVREAKAQGVLIHANKLGAEAHLSRDLISLGCSIDAKEVEQS
jgi:hypothetical protein